jgi:hypothetical protein
MMIIPIQKSHNREHIPLGADSATKNNTVNGMENEVVPMPAGKNYQTVSGAIKMGQDFQGIRF